MSTSTSTSTTGPRLGTEQQAILEALVEHGGWSRGAGWVWSTLSRTQKLCESLEKHRLVEQRVETGRRSTEWRPTPNGVQLVAQWRQERQQRKLNAQASAAPLPTHLNPAIPVRIWKVEHDAGGLVLTLNGQRYQLGASGPAILFDLQQASGGQP